MSMKLVSLNVDEDLRARATEVAKAADQTFTEFVAAALETEIQRRFARKSGEKLKIYLDAKRNYSDSLNQEDKAEAAA